MNAQEFLLGLKNNEDGLLALFLESVARRAKENVELNEVQCTELGRTITLILADAQKRSEGFRWSVDLHLKAMQVADYINGCK